MGTSPGTVVLEQGRRTIRLSSIDQHATYGGLIEGRPDHAMNQGLLARLLTDARRSHVPAHLIEPAERPIEGGGVDREGRPRVALPSIVVEASFTNYDGVAAPDAHGSHLQVIWLQDEWAFPIDHDVAEQLRRLDWNHMAADFWF